MLGGRIAALRKQAGLSQSRLAEKLGVSASAVGMYEQGRREPSVEMIVKLSEIFSVSTDFLLTGETQIPRETETLHRLLLQRLESAGQMMAVRDEPPFTWQEFAIFVAALLRES